MKKIKYLTPILGLSAMVGVAAPIATSCAKAVESTVLPYNLLNIDGVTLKGLVSGTDLTKYDTIEIPEGVKYVALDSFNHAKVVEPNEETEATFDYSTIKKLVLPSTLRAVDGDAFVGLTALSSIDCTSWTADTIQYMDFAANSINPEGWENARYLKVNLPEGLTLNQTQKVKADFLNAGVPAYCFVEQTTGHIAATEGVSKTINTTVSSDTTIFNPTTTKTPQQYAKGDAKVSLTLAETFDTSKYELNVYTQKTAATAYYDDIEDPLDLEIEDYRTLTFTPIMFNTLDLEEEPEEIYYKMLESEGHTVDYDLNIVCTKKSTNEVVWTEKVEGFKLTNTYQHVSRIYYSAAEESYDGFLSPNPLDQAATTYKPAVKVEPENAVVQTYSFSSDNTNIIEVDKTEDFKIRANNPGTANLVVKTDDKLSAASDSVAINLYTIKLDETADKVCSYAGRHVPTGSTEEVSYGYTLPAAGEDGILTMQYKIKLGESGTENTLVYVPYTTEATKVRTFGIYQNKYDPSIEGYNNLCINNVQYAQLHVDRADGVTSYDLEENKHYIMDDNKIYLEDKTSDRDIQEAITFEKGDTLTFTFYLNNVEELLYTGFEFRVLA